MRITLLFFFLLVFNQVNATLFVVGVSTDAGAGSLRQAIIDANADASATSGATHVISVSAVTVTLASELPQINNYITITGPAGGGLIISGNNLYRVISVASGKKLILANLTIQNASVAGSGGGILCYGDLLVGQCTFANNAVTSTGQGGAIAISAGGTAYITASTFKNNTSGNTGGAIVNYGTSTFINCTFSGNSGGSGSGIMDYANCTITNCTIAGNTGEGLNTSASGTTLYNSIVVGNTTDITGTGTIAVTYSLLGTVTGVTVVGANNTTSVTAAAVFGSNTLANNGGLTETILILNPGPAVNTGNSTAAPANDQRGTARDANPDRGAYESTATTGIMDEFISKAIKVHSNPGDGNFYFEISETVTGNIEWEVVDGEGKSILQNKANKGNSVQTYMVDLRNSPSGVYYLIVYSGKASAMKELIKN